MYRASANVLVSDGQINARQGGAGQVNVGASTGAPYITFGAAQDTTLYRQGTAALQTDGVFRAGHQLLANMGLAGSLQVYVGQNQGTPDVAAITWGTDTNLYRSSAGVLKTDGNIQSVGDYVARLGDAQQVTLGFAGPSSQAGFKLGSSSDTNLYRSAVGILKTDGRFYAADVMYASLGTNQLGIGGQGPAGQAGIVFGGSADTNLYRDIAGRLATDGQLRFTSGNGYIYFNALSSAANQPIQVAISGDTQNRFQIYADGKTAWGPGGSTAPDTVLYRQSAQVLRVQGGTYGDMLSIAPTSANLDTTVGIYYRNASGVEVNARATLGAADSGGVGFRVLRVPN